MSPAPTRLVTRRVDPHACRVTHPLTREQCCVGPWGHDLHHTQRSGNWWRTDDGRSTSEVGVVQVTYFGLYVPHPGHRPDEVIEHFPDPIILRSEIVKRTRYGYGTSFEPGGLQRPVRYNSPAPQAYMDVWIMITSDPAVSDPVPTLDTPPTERWSLANWDNDSHRTAYLPVVAP